VGQGRADDRQGDTTAVLQLKVWPLVYFMSVLAAVTAVILLAS
jgi:hypothetical protein